ncbi:MAG: GFA family protein [Gammaproteobacteria bacterium]|nr:GFA family protein [Gammaproteobacteria bacterium]
MVTGGCLCGAVRPESEAEPLATRLGWCRDCQYLAAGAAVNACFRTASFKMNAETTDYVSIADSDNRKHRRFCKSCGTQLFSEAESRPHLIFVRGGSIDDPDQLQPTATIWTASAPRWASIDRSLECIAGQPAPFA